VSEALRGTGPRREVLGFLAAVLLLLLLGVLAYSLQFADDGRTISIYSYHIDHFS
jgi:hypothetical protein